MKRSIYLAGILLMIVSCTSEIDQQNNASRLDPARKKTVYQATTESRTVASPDTKVYADANMLVLWNADDRISIFEKTTLNTQFRFTGRDGDTGGGFDEVSSGHSYTTGNPVSHTVAVYPYSTYNQLSNSGNVVTMDLPAEQAYMEQSFGIGANTMVAVTDGTFLPFKNVGGYLSLRLYGDNVAVSQISLQGNNHEKIAGTADIAVPLGGLPSVTMAGNATEIVSIVCDPPVQLGTTSEDYTDFWFVIPPTEFTGGFTITVTDALGGTFVKSTTNSFTVSRNQLDWMNPLKVVPNYDNVTINFADANFKDYCVENFDTNEDGEISEAEAVMVQSINCNGRSIQSLVGVECFVNLTTLYCYGNQLTSLDASHNTALTILYCNSNQLTSLDVSHNTALTYLACSSNQLKSLDVSHNTALSSLNCDHNQLSSLDVSHNTALTKLVCDHNQLSSLDVSHNTALTQLVCDSNQLTSLDVSHHTALTSLICNNNQLSSLDVSHDTALTLLYCNHNQLKSLIVSSNTSLNYLECPDNQLTSLDVSYNTVLVRLLCGGNQLTSLDVSNNTALTNLSCINNPMTTLYMKTGQEIQTLYKPDETVIVRID